MFRSSVEEHAAHIRSMLSFGGTHTIPLAEALGRVTASVVASPYDLPLFRNSQMDGFAVRAADASAGSSLPVVGEIPARPMTPPRLEPGTAVRIMTGAVVPEGADAVVPIEDTTIENSTIDGDTVTIVRSRSVGEYVREPGSDIRCGEELLPAGLTLASRHLAALAAAGLPSVHVRIRPSVAIITTGSELIASGETPAMGQIFDANAVALVAAVEAAGGVVVFQHRVTDEVAAMEAALAASVTAHVIVTSGGISMGDYEVVREALEPRGARVGTVAMQPGGPQATATFDGAPVICFPGNPVSTQISFELFLAPLLREAAGLPAKATHYRRLAHLVDSVPRKRQFLRGRARPDGRVEVVAGPGSHLVAALAASDLLVIIPEDVTELQEGDAVEVLEL